MLCYDVEMSFWKPKTVFDDDWGSEGFDSEEVVSEIKKLNAAFELQRTDDDWYAAVYRAAVERLHLAVFIRPKKKTVREVLKILTETTLKNFHVGEAKILHFSEIPAKRFIMLLETAENINYFKRGMRPCDRDLKLDYFDNHYFKVAEEVVSGKKLTKKGAIAEAEKLMSDATLLEEIERIYAPENSSKFFGFPVHYRIRTGNRKSAMSIIRLIVRMLYAKNRILSTRINAIREIEENCYEEQDFENLFLCAEGGAVVLEMRGTDEGSASFASGYEAVIKYVGEVVQKYYCQTLIFFLEDVAEPGFTEPLLAEVSETIDVVNVNEGGGSREEALVYLKTLAGESPYAELVDESIEKYLSGRRKYFKCSDIQKAFTEWSKDVLRTKAYAAYQKCGEIPKTVQKKENAYDRLQAMIGLSKVKNLVDAIIAAYRMQAVREGYGFENVSISRHMIFTGNPGSAKTTVARLLADILTSEGILKSGAMVECGRSDLVGKYVGWTAKIVKEKFRKAEGGILFIDEAYSLVDDSRSYGDEAINTIVQEMENHRKDVIVIFAGYPEKMKDFLDRNEGLRSRIAFHLDFPDYKPDELLQIMELMLKERGLKVDKEAKAKCLSIFKRVCTNKEFGNGRFVRNLVEQAMLRQAKRLAKRGSGKKLPKETIMKLIAEDFDEGMTKAYGKPEIGRIGFVV